MPVLRCGPSNKQAHSAPSPNVGTGPAVFYERLLTELLEAKTRQLFAAPRIRTRTARTLPYGLLKVACRSAVDRSARDVRSVTPEDASTRWSSRTPARSR